MNKLQGAIVAGTTDQGFNWLAPVIFYGEKNLVGPVIEHRINKLILSTNDLQDPYAIDYALAQTIQGLPVNIKGLGISLSVPNAAGPSGGIIGNPHLAPQSAKGISEDIENGLSLAAFPGGPGLIVKGTTTEALTALSGIKPGSGGSQVLNVIGKKLKIRSIPLAIAVTDGIATTGGGALLVMGAKHWIEHFS